MTNLQLEPSGRLRHRMVVAPGSVRVLTELRPGHRSMRQTPADCDLEELAPLEEAFFPAEGHGELFDQNELDQDYDDGEVALAKGRRITGFSNRSRARMMYRISTLDWAGRKGVPEMVTLTYPREFPTDGRLVKQHLEAFRKRWHRKFGEPPSGVWKLEFQRRGAPHVHLYVFRPVMGWRVFLTWARDVWAEIVGSGDPLHREFGVRVDRQFVAAARSVRKLAGYFAKHNAKDTTKHYQNEVPDGFANVGRFWGVWAMTNVAVEVEISTQQFVDIRRLLMRLQRQSGRKRKAPGRLIGCWSLSYDGYKFAAQVLRLVEETVGAIAEASVSPVDATHGLVELRV